MISDQEFEGWRNRQWSGMLQALDPVKTWEGARNMSAMPTIETRGNGRISGLQFYREMTSAEQAKYRLHGIVANDRKACGDGKWVKRWDRRWLQTPWRCYASKTPAVIEMLKAWKRADKARYRWQWRN